MIAPHDVAISTINNFGRSDARLILHSVASGRRNGSSSSLSSLGAKRGFDFRKQAEKSKLAIFRALQLV